jgi:hypothetical protein
MPSLRIERRLGRDLVDAAGDALECEDKNETALVNLLLAADGVAAGLEYSLVGDVGDGAIGWPRPCTALLSARRCCSSGGFIVGDFSGARSESLVCLGRDFFSSWAMTAA